MKKAPRNRTADGQLACAHGSPWRLGRPSACCVAQLERDIGVPRPNSSAYAEQTQLELFTRTA